MRYTTMYNKLFTKILDSSIWLESTSTRLLWMVFIAAMDEDGFCPFASLANLAHRARLTLEETKDGVESLEAPDPNSSDPDNDGRRIERVQGGWIVLNAAKYRALVTRTVSREQTRVRVARFRQKKTGNADVTTGNADVTPSEAVAVSKAEEKENVSAFEEFWRSYPKKKGKGDAEKAWFKLKCERLKNDILSKLEVAKKSLEWTKDGGQFIPHPATWLNRKGWEDEFDLLNTSVLPGTTVQKLSCAHMPSIESLDQFHGAR